jgi:multidrug efflux system membrane fusion protein
MATVATEKNSGVSSGRNETEASSGSRRRPWLWVLVIGAMAAGVYGYRNRSQAPAAAANQRQASAASVPVIAAAVESRDVPVYLRGLGSVTAFNTVTVKSRVDGQILQVAFREGQFVKEGDLLVQIDPRPFQVALDQAQGQLAKDEAQLTSAKLDLARDQKLVQEGVFSQQQFDQQTAAVGQIEGAIQSDKAQIDNQKLQLTYCRITAPLSGRIGLRLADQGNIVHASDQTGLAVITQVQPIAVLFTIPEDSLPAVTRQMREGELRAEAYGRDDQTRLAVGKLLTIDNTIDQSTGTIRLKAQFENSDLQLWPNQFVNIRLLLSMKKGAIYVPTAAIQRGQQGTFVYVVKPDSHAEVRQVQVDFTEGNGTVISGGLAAGEQVVVDGQDKLQGNTKVELRPGGNGSSKPSSGAPK